ncbi:MAG: DUF6144 family protein [Spirochaetales bacterium]|nr:DUF6144 family protein [Spirochaetales bacterium]
MFEIRDLQEKVLFSIIEEYSNTELAKKIVYDENDTHMNDCEWVKSTMQKLEDNFNESQIEMIRMKCQCGYGMDEKLKLLNFLIMSSSSLEDFAAKKEADAAGLYLENGELYLKFDNCPCPMLQKVDQLKTDTWCKCTIGYTKTLFEKAFKCDVDVILLKSIKTGDTECLQKVDIKNFDWNKRLQ